MPAPVVVSQCFPIKTSLAPGCHDKEKKFFYFYVFYSFFIFVSQCFPIKTRLAPGCHDHQGHHHDEDYVFPIMVRATRQR